MLASLLRSWFAPAVPCPDQLPMCVPEWSEPMAEQHAAIWWNVKSYTMTSVERVVALCQSIAYLHNHRIAGDIVECGVWRGGSMMAAALALLSLDSTTRQLHLYDTFTGMTPPAPVDVDWQGRSARDVLRDSSAEGDLARGRCPLQNVKSAMMLTRYPWEKMLFIQGPVEKTIPQHLPNKIALLRLDTDWYESTYHELEHLYPRLVEGGVLIVDDYGHWQGAKKAVDQYFADHGIDADLRPIDYTGRLLLKRQTATRAMAA
ncbi:MAG: class I SAM-dependent methyltransferase [Planctomycetes bacterium]|nr:class I SAM-dependent methyltransferase [Planctomycetota bacterium]